MIVFIASIFEKSIFWIQDMFLSNGMQVNPIPTQKSIALQHNFTVKIYSAGTCALLLVLYKWGHAKVLSSKMNGAIWSFKVGFFRVEK